MENNKKEILEEAALSFLPHSEVFHDTDFIIGFEFGATWQQKNMFSEDDKRELKKMLYKLAGGEIGVLQVLEWFEKK